MSIKSMKIDNNVKFYLILPVYRSFLRLSATGRSRGRRALCFVAPMFRVLPVDGAARCVYSFVSKSPRCRNDRAALCAHYSVCH